MPFADARLRAAPGELGPRAPDAQRPLHVAEGVRPLLWAAPGGLALGGLVLGGHVPGLLAGAVPVLAPRAGFGLHRGALAAAAQMIGTGGRRGFPCRRPRPLATTQVARARTPHRSHGAHCALRPEVRRARGRRTTSHVRQVLSHVRRFFCARATVFWRTCDVFLAHVRKKSAARAQDFRRTCGTKCA